MSYQDLINQSIGMVYQAGIATKILQHMGRIRNSSDIHQARRWVMELLQNARDVSWPDSMVKVRLELSEQELKFSHTGRPFRIKDVLSIVNQVSSKLDDENSVGQFGTGFVTTFQLSEQVKLTGVLKEEGLPYKPFEVCIDRQGFTKDEVLLGIEQAMNVLKTVDSSAELTDYCKEGFNTTFTYALKNDNSREIARIGMADLSETICYILLFSKKIESVELKYITAKGEKTICYKQGENRHLGENLYLAEFIRIDNDTDEQKFSICYSTREGMTLAANYSEEEGFLPLSKQCARLFIDFPLIGAERFCFPIVINDLGFQPNEPRSGISLVDNANSKDALINKALIKKAVEGYKEFLAEALKLSLKGLHHIMEIPCYEKNREISENWVKSHIYKSLYRYIEGLPMFETAIGKKRLNDSNMFLLRGENYQEVEGLKVLLKVVKGIYYPEDNIDWYQTLIGYDLSEEKLFHLEKLLHVVETFIRSKGVIDEQQISLVKWCEGLYKLAMENEVFARRIRAGEIAIFPSQKLENGRVYYLRKLQEIRLDPGIPERLKDVTEILDVLEPQNSGGSGDRCCIREQLLHTDFVISNLSEMMPFEWSKLGNYIDVKSNESFPVLNYRSFASFYKEKRKQAWILMASCGPDAEMYELISQFFDEDISAYEECQTLLNAGVWRHSYHGLLKLCVNEISNSSKLEGLRWYQSKRCPDIYKWLNLFYKKWLYYKYNNEENWLPIYLNQENNFKCKEEIKRDNIKAKELKKIAFGLKDFSKQCNYYCKLLHEKIIVENLNLLDCDNREIAVTINQEVTQLLYEYNLADASVEQQEACSLLLAWIQENLEEAKKYFPIYSTEEGMMKLLTPKAAVRMQQKVYKLEKMLELIGCENEEAAFQKLQEMLEKAEQSQKMIEKEEQNSVFEFSGGDVYLDNELFSQLSLEDDEETFRSVCREIGIAGEKYVLGVLKEYYLQQNMEIVSDNGAEIKLESGDLEQKRNVMIHYPDRDNYHQAGWDISITDSNNDYGTEYIEIKTHTKKSGIKNRIRLSNEQMKMAIAKREQYHVLVVTYDYYEKKGEAITVYDGFLKHIQTGELKNTLDGYEFYI